MVGAAMLLTAEHAHAQRGSESAEIAQLRADLQRALVRIEMLERVILNGAPAAAARPPAARGLMTPSGSKRSYNSRQGAHLRQGRATTSEARRAGASHIRRPVGKSTWIGRCAIDSAPAAFAHAPDTTNDDARRDHAHKPEAWRDRSGRQQREGWAPEAR